MAVSGRSPRSRRPFLFPALLYFFFLLGLCRRATISPVVSPVTSWSSSESPAPLDAGLYPPLQETEPNDNDIQTTLHQHTDHVETDHETNVQRDKRSSEQWDNAAKSPPRRVKTGDTILNIRGAVRDAIGDAGAAPGPRASSRLDTFVIRPAQARARPRLLPLKQPPLNQVPRHERELLVSPHATARIPCDCGNSTDLRWYKDNEEVQVGADPEGPTRRAGGGVEVTRATRGDAGAWRCVSRAPVCVTHTQLLVYEPVRSVYLAVDGRRLDAGNTWVPVRDKTELEVRCVAEGGVPPPELSWRLLALEPTLDYRPYLRIQPTNYSIEGVSSSHAVVTAARELHNGSLQCEARQRTPRDRYHDRERDRDRDRDHDRAGDTPASTPAPALSAKLEIHVTYPPSFVISRWPGFGVSLSAGGAAALRCDVDANPPARAWWLRDDDPTSSPPPLQEAPGSATLRWASLSSAHAGWYRCRALWLDTDYSSIGYYLNVIAPEENTEAATEATTVEEEDEEPEHQKVEVPVGGNVQLHCPKGSVGCWWRKVVGNSSESWAPAGSHHAHGVLGIKEAMYSEGGEYRCIGAQAASTRARELKRVTVSVTGVSAAALSATPDHSGGVAGWRLECGVCGRGVRAVWLRARAPPAPAALAPDLAQHCWRARLHVDHGDEMWCVAAAPSGGAVAVFPPRAPHPSPAPARHTVRAPYSGGAAPAPALARTLLPLAAVLELRLWFDRALLLFGKLIAVTSSRIPMLTTVTSLKFKKTKASSEVVKTALEILFKYAICLTVISSKFKISKMRTRSFKPFEYSNLSRELNVTVTPLGTRPVNAVKSLLYNSPRSVKSLPSWHVTPSSIMYLTMTSLLAFLVTHVALPV